MATNIITVSGASACGKSFYIDEVTKRFPNITETLGLTTRPIRPGEINGKSGNFLTEEEMDELDRKGKLVLIKEFWGYRYAWMKDDLVNDDNIRIFNIFYKTISELRDMGLNLYAIFIKPETDDMLIDRLKMRTTGKEQLEKRIRAYYDSIDFLNAHPEVFDLIFINRYDDESLNSFLKSISDATSNSGKQNNGFKSRFLTCNSTLPKKFTK